MAVTRFVVSWIPTEVVEVDARKKGWTPEGSTSLWDHVSPEYYENEESFDSFAEALDYARIKIPHDVFGTPRIEKMRSRTENDEHGPWTEWDRLCGWEIDAESEPAEDRPDWQE